MADRSYEAWYERVRRSDKVSIGDITDASAEQVLKEFQEYEPSQKQVEGIAERQRQDDINQANLRNSVSTKNAAEISDDSAYRPGDTDDTFISVKGDKPDIAADRVEGSYTANGVKFIRVDGKIYGAVDE